MIIPVVMIPVAMSGVVVVEFCLELRSMYIVVSTPNGHFVISVTARDFMTSLFVTPQRSKRYSEMKSKKGPVRKV